MPTITFDTHKFIRRLKEAGISEEQAEAIAEAFRDANMEAEIATKTSDLCGVGCINTGINKSRAKNETENAEITTESRARPTTLDGDLGKVGRLESSNDNSFKDSALLALPALLKNKGIGIRTEIMLQKSNRFAK